MADRPPKPDLKYGEWTRGNAGQVGRTVTDWHWSDLAGEWLFIVSWEPHPDERRLSPSASPQQEEPQSDS